MTDWIPSSFLVAERAAHATTKDRLRLEKLRGIALQARIDALEQREAGPTNPLAAHLEGVAAELAARCDHFELSLPTKEPACPSLTV